jgi:hypothetical protein
MDARLLARSGEERLGRYKLSKGYNISYKIARNEKPLRPLMPAA